ncbi:MAG TPA: fibronectin type III domain-containing protein, partial [Ilumatobacteraceae bacterium]|nr:fibronectin type III domain-containing protein [Ilumatobacteraceae bacterium]
DVMASVESNATTGAYQFRANPGHYWVKAVAGGDHAGVEIFVLEDSGKISQDNSTVISMPGIDTRINAPTAVTSTQGLNGRSLTLSWTRDSELTTEVRIAGGTWTSVSGTSQLFTGLTPSTSYTFELRTKSSSGYSSPVFSTQSTGPVTAPQALTLTADSDSISASWTAVATLSYQVRIYKTGDTPSANDWVDADSTSGHTFTGLDASTSYVVEVRAFISTFFSAISSDTISTDA